MSVSPQHVAPNTTLSPQEKPKAGASWKATEQHVLPHNRLGIVFSGFMASVFLAAMDQTIVAVALPTIVDHLGEGKNYSWVGSAYLLAACALSPLWGKLSDLVGRKPVLYSVIFIFLLGSTLCGAAKTMTWLIVCRGIQGAGGGGIVQLVQITMSDIVSLQDRGKYYGLLGMTWGVASVTGPLIGGVISDHISWRWCFWINLPTGCIAAAIIFFSLNLNPHQGMSLRQHISQFDFIGLTLLISGIICVLIGLDSGETNWTSAETIALLCAGCTMLILAAINEIFTTRSPIIPPRLFRTRTTAIILTTCFLHAIIFFTGSYYLPLYYQVLGSSATRAGIWSIPFSFGIAAMSVPGGFIVSRLGTYRGIIWVSWALTILGCGLMTMLDDHSNMGEKVFYPFVAAAGLGLLYQTPLIALQAAMPLKDMATSTSSYTIFRNMGGTVGVSAGQAIYSSILKRKIDRIPGLGGFDTSPAALAQSVRTLQLLPQPERGQIVHAYAQSISAIWISCTPVVGLGFIMALFIKAYSLKQTTVQGGAHAKPDEEMAVSDTTTAASGRTDLSDEKLEVQGHKQSLQLARGQAHAGFDVIELTVLKG